MNISQLLTKLKTLVYSKSETDSLLGGKASSSHTHTKSQITDFPSYGNTAGTICQGNDARLSDARTPTSHTHTKSQITDFPTIPSKTSQLTNDSGFITGVTWANVSGKPSTFAPSSHTHTKNQITDFPSLATVATSGSYNDLSNKPSIPSIDLRPQASADANTVSDGVSITHYGSNGPATSLGASANDGALFQQCWSSAWKVQIAADYRNGNLFTRGKNNGTWKSWRAVAYHGDKVSKFTNDSGYITSSGSCNYANSAGSAPANGGTSTATAYMNQYDTITYGVNRLQYYNISTSTTSGATNKANPANDWYYHLLMSHANSGGWYGDLAMCFHSNTLAFRRIVNGTDNGWCYLVKNGRTIVSGYEVYVG